MKYVVTLRFAFGWELTSDPIELTEQGARERFIKKHAHYIAQYGGVVVESKEA